MRCLQFPRHASPSRQHGVGLIEVLIAVLVVSIGFLGVAALQVYSLSTNNSAMANSMATVASYSILDAMRLDKTHLASYEGADVCLAVPSTATLAGTQLHQWCGQLASNLANAKGKISCGSPDPDGVCTVTITFDDVGVASASTAQSGTAQPVTVTTKALL